jgi:protease-4
MLHSPKPHKSILKTITIVGVVFLLILIIAGYALIYFDEEEYYFTECPIGSNVAIIKIYGEIITYGTETIGDFGITEDDITSSETITDYLNQINEDDEIKAIIVEIDSPGGYPVASEEIANALKKIEKPTVAVIRESGASGAYLIASATDKIYASRMSDVGSIGVTMSYLDYSQQNKKEGLIYQQLSSGEFKDAGDPDKELSDKEKEIIMRDIKKIHQIFIEMVAENRNLDIEKVEKLADGSTMLGQDAKENGLIDEIGSVDEAKNWLEKELKIEANVCVYE